MAFEATKREWGELYAFFRLLADGYVYAGTPDVKRNEVQKFFVVLKFSFPFCATDHLHLLKNNKL